MLKLHKHPLIKKLVSPAVSDPMYYPRENLLFISIFVCKYK